MTTWTGKPPVPQRSRVGARASRPARADVTAEFGTTEAETGASASIHGGPRGRNGSAVVGVAGGSRPAPARGDPAPVTNAAPRDKRAAAADRRTEAPPRVRSGSSSAASGEGSGRLGAAPAVVDGSLGVTVEPRVRAPQPDGGSGLAHTMRLSQDAGRGRGAKSKLRVAATGGSDVPAPVDRPRADAVVIPGTTVAVRQARVRSRFEQAVAGVDEAGRGPWAGPVVVAAVLLPRGLRIEGLADSKELTPQVREMLFNVIVREAEVSTVVVAAQRIDTLNIRGATLWGMARAVATLPCAPTVALIDGIDVPPNLSICGRALVQGDRRSSAISAASIVAKVTRDRLMTRLAEAFPGYGFERHKGYGTPEHRAALSALGPCIHHRRSFAPVREALARPF